MTCWKLGLLGLDTPHVVHMARLLGSGEVTGGRIVAAYPGGSDDFELSRSRVKGYTATLKNEFGVAILDDPEAVAEQADIVLITAVDGRCHRALLEATIGLGKPTFIDKPFATSLADAQAMVDLAEARGVPLMSCSSWRYHEPFQAAIRSHSSVLGCDVFGWLEFEATQPGLFWYGIHCVEMVIAAMDVGCVRVSVMASHDVDLISAEWADGRVATIRGMRCGAYTFGGVLHTENGPVRFDDDGNTSRTRHARLLEAILANLPHGRSAVPTGQMLEVMRLIEAANESRALGRLVETAPLSGVT